MPAASRRTRVLAAALILSAAGGLAAFRAASPGSPDPPPLDLEQPGAAVAGLAEAEAGPPDPDAAMPAPAAGPGAARPVPVATVTVHVVGPVARPGVVTLPAGSRVEDAVAAAGGFRASAVPPGLNLARLLVDGERLDTAAAEPAPAPGPAAGTAGAPTGPLDLNTATLEQLDALPGVGPVMAQRILDHRAQHGRFGSVEELAEVPGIGEKRLADLREQLRIAP